MSTVIGQHIVDLEVDLAVREVLRMMGGAHRGNVSPMVVDLTSRLLGECADLVAARGVYQIYNIASMGENELRLANGCVFHGRIAQFLKPARRVAVFVVTVGNILEEMAEARMRAGNRLEGFVLHAIGSAAADAAADALVDHVWANVAGSDEAVTPPYSPGYCGMPIEEQQPLFSLVDSSVIGVKLLPSIVMSPLKSVSGLAGIGISSEIGHYSVPCEHCDLADCRMRRDDRGIR